RNDSADAVRITPPTSSDTWTMIGVIEFGSTCRRRMRRWGTPVALALSTNGRPVTDAAWPRTILVYHGHHVTEIAMTVFVIEGSITAANASASSSAGNARKTSVTREITSSIQPPKYPAAIPSGTPMSTEIASTSTAITGEMRAP